MCAAHQPLHSPPPVRDEGRRRRNPHTPARCREYHKGAAAVARMTEGNASGPSRHGLFNRRWRGRRSPEPVGANPWVCASACGYEVSEVHTPAAVHFRNHITVSRMAESHCNGAQRWLISTQHRCEAEAITTSHASLQGSSSSPRFPPCHLRLTQACLTRYGVDRGQRTLKSIGDGRSGSRGVQDTAGQGSATASLAVDAQPFFLTSAVCTAPAAAAAHSPVAGHDAERSSPRQRPPHSGIGRGGPTRPSEASLRKL